MSNIKQEEKEVWREFAVAAFHSYTNNVNGFKWTSGNEQERSEAAAKAADLLTKEYLSRYGEKE